MKTGLKNIVASVAPRALSTNPFGPELDKMGRLVLGYRGAKVLFVAAELDLFRLLDKTDGTGKAVARRARASVRHVSILLDALSSLGFLEKRENRYKNTLFSREFLHPEGNRSMSNNLRYQEFLSIPYAGLTETVRLGKPREGLGKLLSRRPEFVRDYIRGMADIARRPAQELAVVLDLSKAQRMLDVGGGPGTFSLACLARQPKLEATILDLPMTLKHTMQFVKSSPWGRRVHFQRGNYLKDSFGKELYDIVLLSHVTHDEGPKVNLSMIRKAKAALRPGGQLIIHDFMTGDDGTNPSFSVLFSVHLLTYTNDGQTYSEREYKEWLSVAGFSAPRRVALCPDLPNNTIALIAVKQDSK
jgi:SAM-dependent methyltransferase